MRRQFYGYVRVFFQHLCQAVECLARVFCEVGFVKFVEHVAHEHGNADARQRELQHVLAFHLRRVGSKRRGVVEIAPARGEKQIVHARLHRLLERAVGKHAQFLVRAVAAHHIHHCLGQFVAVLLIYPALHRLQHFGIRKFENLVPASSARGAVGGEETTVVQALERDAEIVGKGVHRRGQVLHFPRVAQSVLCGAVKVEAAHSAASVAGEIEFAVGAEGGETLVARRVNGRSEIFNRANAVAARDAGAPKVEAAHTARHVGGEIEPAAVGRRGRVGVRGERVGSDFQSLGLAPRRVGAVGRPYFCHTGILRIGAAYGEIHRFAVGRKGASPFVEISVHALHLLRRFPLTLFVERGKEDVAVFRARDAAYLVARHLLARGGEIDLLGLLSHKGRGVVRARAVEERHGFHGIGRAALLHLWRDAAGLQSEQGSAVAGKFFQIIRERLFCPLVIVLHQQHLTEAQAGNRVGVTIAHGVAVRASGPSHVAVAAECLAHFEGNGAALVALLIRCAHIGTAILPRCLAVFAERKGRIAALDALFRAAAGREHRERAK